MRFEVTILGCGSATPTVKHLPTSQFLEHDSHFFLIDCGEGAQLQMKRYGLKFQKINHIFISHNHGDHFLGLPGLISTMHLLGREKPLHIYAQPGLKEAVEHQLLISHSKLRFQLIWHHPDPTGMHKIFEDKKLEVHSFPLNHRIACCGFLFLEKKKLRNIKREYIEKYNIPVPRIKQIKQGSDYTTQRGEVIPNEELTLDPDQPRSYAFCSDTAYAKETSQYVKGVDMLYHESTFRKADASRALETYHSTTLQAAQVAREAGVKKLLLGHYSARYRKDEPFLDEAKSVFENTELTNEGDVFAIGNVEKKTPG